MDWQPVIQSLPSLWEGMKVTLLLCLIAASCTLISGSILASLMIKSKGFWQRLLQAYVTISLGLPVLIIIYVLYYVLPEYGITFSSWTVGILGLTIYYTPYVAQVIRAAIESLPKGQTEAAHTLGLTPLQTLRDVILPQTLTPMLSPLAGLMIGLIKDSALLSIISTQEFMYAAKQAISSTYAPLEIYLAVALAYWVLNSLIDLLARYAERRFSHYLR